MLIYNRELDIHEIKCLEDSCEPEFSECFYADNINGKLNRCTTTPTDNLVIPHFYKYGYGSDTYITPVSKEGYEY